MSNILHLSDLHFGCSETTPSLWCSQLIDDLRKELGCNHLDALVLSGDIANKSTPKEYDVAKKFLVCLCEEFHLNFDQILIVPGNHDLNWTLAKKSYRTKQKEEYRGPRDENGNPDENDAIDKNEFIQVKNQEKYKDRFKNFKAFYDSLKSSPYPREYDQQWTLLRVPEQKILILGLNSAWNIDHHYKDRSSIHPIALSNALQELRVDTYTDWLKIAVFHHPVHGDVGQIKEHGFMERLAVNGFRLILHGHIHTSKSELFRYDQAIKGRKLDVICAGTFGAPTRELVPGYPWQYNLLKLTDEKLTVETRRREEAKGAWKPDARWLQGRGRTPLPYYEVDLSDEREQGAFISGAILYVDIRGFTNLLPSKQQIAIQFIKKEINNFRSTFGQTQYWFDFLGSDFLLFLENSTNEPQRQVLAKASAFGLKLQLDSCEQSLELGVTLHWEDNATYHDFGDNRRHLVGSGIDEARLLMSFSDDGHFFISSKAYESLGLKFRSIDSFQDFLHITSVSSFNINWPHELLEQRYLCETITFHDQNKHPYELHNLDITNFIGNPSIPDQRVSLEDRDKSPIDDPHHRFTKHLIENDKITIIGITHEGTISFLKSAGRSREQFWNNLEVIFPCESFLEKMIDQYSLDKNSAEVRRQRWLSGKKAISKFIFSQKPEDRDHCQHLEFNGNLSFIGNWFQGKKNNATIRFAPILHGADQRDTYYIEVQKGMPAYDKLAHAFEAISTRSREIVEWRIYGQLKGSHFQYLGIVNWKNLQQIIETNHKTCFPVVIIIVYAPLAAGACRVFLQKREKYNAADRIGKFSNISGYVTDNDVYKAMNLHEVIDNLTYKNSKEKCDNDIASTQEFNNWTNLKRGDPFNFDIYKETAIREVNEELGLKITTERLRDHGAIKLKRDDKNLFFKIYSLELRLGDDELKLIKRFRPHAALPEPQKSFTIKKLCQYHEKEQFNDLLQQKFDFFLSIFRELGIDE